MAKNFASVLEALRKAGLDKQSDVERSYTASRGWLLEQFKAAQASFSDLTAEGSKQPDDQAHQVCQTLVICSCSKCVDNRFAGVCTNCLPRCNDGATGYALQGFKCALMNSLLLFSHAEHSKVSK